MGEGAKVVVVPEVGEVSEVREVSDVREVQEVGEVEEDTNVPRREKSNPTHRLTMPQAAGNNCHCQLSFLYLLSLS